MTFEFSNKVKDLKPSAIREIFKSLTDPSVISFAAGNPCKVIRAITEEDKKFYFKDRQIDEETFKKIYG